MLELLDLTASVLIKRGVDALELGSYLLAVGLYIHKLLSQTLGKAAILAVEQVEQMRVILQNAVLGIGLGFSNCHSVFDPVKFHP